MTLSELTEGLASALALPGLALNAQGVCQIVVDGDLVVTIEAVPGRDRAHIYAVIATLQEIDDTRGLATLLSAQLFGRELGEGLSFALDESTGEILLQKLVVPSELEVDSLSQDLAEFVNWADHWRTKLRNAPTSSLPGQDPGNMAFVRA